VDYTNHYPESAPQIGKSDEGFAAAAMPLIIQDRVLGALAIHIPRDQAIEPGERDFFIALAHQCAQAIDRALLYEAESEARRAAEHANQMRTQALGMLSHEIRTPLTTIKGFTTTLLSPDVNWERESQEEFLGIINYETERLTELADDLLELTRIEAGQFRINAQPTALHNIIAEGLPAMNTLAKDHKLNIEGLLEMPEVIADSKRIIQVLCNLVSNASRHSPQGAEIKVQANQDGNRVRIDVIDQGPGIAPELRDRVFQPFQQGSAIGNGKPGGAGLGLTIAKAIVEAHGGRIWFSEPDGSGGTIFSFTIPVAEA
jgi:K+-sensing histidine kinase KdpD